MKEMLCIVSELLDPQNFRSEYPVEKLIQMTRLCLAVLKTGKCQEALYVNLVWSMKTVLKLPFNIYNCFSTNFKMHRGDFMICA